MIYAVLDRDEIIVELFDTQVEADEYALKRNLTLPESDFPLWWYRVAAFPGEVSPALGY